MGSVNPLTEEVRSPSSGKTYTAAQLIREAEFADSYRAVSDGQKVFLKQYKEPSVLFTSWFCDYESYQAEIIRRLRGLNLMAVQVLDAFTYNNEYFQTHEWAEGGDLDGYIKNRKDLASKPAFDEALYYARTLLFELQHLHDAGIIHTDLKPDNVFVHKRPGGTPLVRLVDFDWAIMRDRPRYPWDSGPRGTPFYMSPEHLSGRPVTDRSDVYTAALIVSELLTGVNILKRVCGQRSFTPDELAAFLLPIQAKRNVPKPSQLDPSVRLPKHIDDSLYMCLHPDPAQRPSAKQLYAILIEDEQRPVRLLLRDSKTPNLFVRFSRDDWAAGRVKLCQEYCALLPGKEYLSSLANGRFNAYILPSKNALKWFIAPPGTCKPTNVILLNGKDVLGNERLSKGDRVQIVDRQTRTVCVELLVDFEYAS